MLEDSERDIFTFPRLLAFRDRLETKMRRSFIVIPLRCVRCACVAALGHGDSQTSRKYLTSPRNTCTEYFIIHHVYTYVVKKKNITAGRNDDSSATSSTNHMANVDVVCYQQGDGQHVHVAWGISVC